MEIDILLGFWVIHLHQQGSALERLGPIKPRSASLPACRKEEKEEQEGAIVFYGSRAGMTKVGPRSSVGRAHPW